MSCIRDAFSMNERKACRYQPFLDDTGHARIRKSILILIMHYGWVAKGVQTSLTSFYFIIFLPLTVQLHCCLHQLGHCGRMKWIRSGLEWLSFTCVMSSQLSKQMMIFVAYTWKQLRQLNMRYENAFTIYCTRKDMETMNCLLSWWCVGIFFYC